MNGASRGVLHGFMSLVTWGDSETRVDGVRRRLDAIDASSPRRRSITPDAHRDSPIQRGLKKRLAQLADERERRQRAAEKADEDFSLEFLSAAREVFTMIDDDESGTLEKPEMSARGVRPSTRRASRRWREIGGRSSRP